MFELVDTHCHIQSADNSLGERATRELWSKDGGQTGDSLVQAAIESGVTKLICVGCDVSDSQLAIDFAKSRANCWASIGVHPHEAQNYAHNQRRLDQFAALASAPKVVAVGECGLDYFYGHSPRADQVTILKYQIELALAHDLPLIFHVREAFADFWPIFDIYHTSGQKVRGVLHSFTDNQTNLDEALKRGLYIGVNGIATFVKDPAQRAVYRSIPLANLMLETDAPYLTPSPYRGTINGPKHVLTIANFLSDLRSEAVSTLATSTTANAQHLFGI